ncbi:MAG: polysaccharide biosynthesis tyrosine autokinase [Candidatus Hydrogenedentes bacterium]|nr:polysaccharide biosynthesis tyrosine autokinase [Candidatus Hydrogenedentota bacterium]
MRKVKEKGKLLGELMVESGVISISQLHRALDYRQKHQCMIGEALVTSGYIGEQTLQSFLRRQLGPTELVSLDSLNSPHASEFYRLQTSLKFALFSDLPIKSLMITSSVPGEGKTLCVSYLALAMAHVMDQRTLAVDADLRHPSLHRRFGLSNSLGLSNLIVDSVNIDECIKDTDIGNLKVLSSGPVPPNPAALLASERMRVLVDELKTKFDLVLFDTPPLFPVSDAAILSAFVDGSMLVVQAAATRRDLVQRAARVLGEGKAKLLGVILNQSEEAFPKYVYKRSGQQYYSANPSETSSPNA